ncbi:BnaCnng75760D [Brassica napus]|uniref:BnaCnng75760D protein n=1 Tax=Brassica napus TaxID=3708 RepID=A0A078K071_BRANA|nr:BnaCnng75760D [Brassica napus]
MMAPNREGLVIASTVGRRSMISFANSVEPMNPQGERRHQAEDGGDSSTSQADSKKRPPGVKASKASGKKTFDPDKQVEEFERIWKIKQKEIDAKEHLSKMSLLDSLIGKKEPLLDFSFHRMLLFCLIKFFLVSREWRVGQEQEKVESGEADKTTRECSIVSRDLFCFVLSCSCCAFGHRTCTNALICIWSRVFVRLIKCIYLSLSHYHHSCKL